MLGNPVIEYVLSLPFLYRLSVLANRAIVLLVVTCTVQKMTDVSHGAGYLKQYLFLKILSTLGPY